MAELSNGSVTLVQAARFAALGARLAVRGRLAKVALGLCAITSVAAIVAALRLGAPGSGSGAGSGMLPVDLPGVVAKAVMWGGGFWLVYAASAHAFVKDATLGVRHLFSMRAGSRNAYVAARLMGASVVVAASGIAGTLASSLVLAGVRSYRWPVANHVQNAIAAIVYCMLFALVVVPLAYALVGGRRRAGGMFLLVAVIWGPHWLTEAMRTNESGTLLRVASIPSALETLRTWVAIMPGAIIRGQLGAVRRDLGARAIVAACGLAAVSVVASRLAARSAERALLSSANERGPRD